MSVNLYWKNAAKFRSLVETPFKTEQELEKYVFDNQEILGGDISIIHRQIRTGNKHGIPDMLGVDQDGRIVLIELKNVEADEDILPQALGYAIWAETNPDSIKALWLESKTKPEEVDLDWDNLSVRIILIAPSFKPTVPGMADKINYTVDLIAVRRYLYEGDEFVSIETLESAPQQRVKTTKALGDWSWEYYEENHGAKAAAEFKHAVTTLEALAKHKGWDLPYNLNKYYTGFKAGNRVVFNVAWETYTGNLWNVALKLPKEIASAFEGQHWELVKYYPDWKEAAFRATNPANPDFQELEPLLVAAYQHVTGRK